MSICFMAAGLVLLTAMIGAIILTLHHKVGVKRQDVAAQNARTPAAAVELRKKPFRKASEMQASSNLSRRRAGENP